MRLLALDTSTDACSAALYVDGTIHERFEVAPRRHAELILPMVDGLLSEAQLDVHALDALAFGRGPGTFTGVRIATGVVQGIAFGAELPVVPVSTLAAIAQGLHEERGWTHVLVALDARMGEVYWGGYRCDEAGLMRGVVEEMVCPPAEVRVPAGSGWQGAGSGWAVYRDALAKRTGEAVSDWEMERYPRARDMLPLARDALRRGAVVSAEQALPVYLRDEVAWNKEHE